MDWLFYSMQNPIFVRRNNKYNTWRIKNMADLKSTTEKIALEACKLDAFRQINLVGIKDNLEEMLAMIGRDEIFDEYTKHTITHVDKMLQLLDIIITGQTKGVMTDADWLLIVLSFYFHDLGMLVTKKEYRDRGKNEEYLNYKKDYLKEKKNEVSLHYFRKEEEKEHFLYQEYVRENHGKRIADWLRNENIDIYDKVVVDIVVDMVKNMPALFINDLACICASHNEDDLDDAKKYPVKRVYGTSPNEMANVFFAAILLRTADLIHITSDRTPTIEFRLISPTNPVSQLEWAKQSSVNGISVKDKTNDEGNVDHTIQSDTLTVTGYFKDYKGYFALMDYLAYARKQLTKSYKLNEEIKRKYAITYDFPWKYIDDDNVETKDFERKQLSFSIDQQKTLDLLVGETLYNNLTVSLRELAQNAIDAVKVNSYEVGNEGNKDYSPKVDVFWDAYTRKLIISDNGTGMNMDIIENHLLKVGSSRYQDEDFKKQHPDYNSISRFGIGLLSCFLVADDVNILTQMKDVSKPLLLKINKLHGRYLLRHGVEEGSLLKLTGKTGTSIELTIRPEIDFNPEQILKNWILVPNCEFVYHEAKRNEPIGYKDTYSYIESSLRKRGIKVDDKDFKIETKVDAGVDFSILLRRNKYVNEWNFVEYSDIFGNQEVDEVPCGLAIEGIRIDENTPGFKTAYYISMINLSGKNAPQTNVARSSINSLTIDRALRTIYTQYLDVINTQIDQLSKDYSITWASSELSYLLNSLSRKNNNSGDILLNNKIFNQILQSQKYYLVERDKKRELCSMEGLKTNSHFWLIESAAYNSANNLLREINTSDYSAVELLKTLYGKEHPMLKGIDVLLSGKRYNNSLDKLLLDNFQATDIQLFKEYRCMVMQWSVVETGKKYWKCIDMEQRISRNINENLYMFLQDSDKVVIKCDDYECIKSDYGIFLFSNNKVHEYLFQMAIKLNNGNDRDIYILKVLCAFIYQCFLSSINKVENWKVRIDDYFTQNFTNAFYKNMKEKVDITELVDICSKCNFNLYDKSRWYRDKLLF